MPPPVDDKQALFTGDDSSRGLEQLVSGEHTASNSRSIPVRSSDGTVGSATLLCRSGEFTYVPFEVRLLAIRAAAPLCKAPDDRITTIRLIAVE